MDNLLDAGFVIAATAFFTTQFELSGKWAIAAAFLVTLFVVLEETVKALLPAPVGMVWTAVASVLKLFIASAGSYDLIKNFIKLSTRQQLK
jgi:hypothetical protein